ncbi:hypothetical protein [Bacillus sp. FJAT-27225]|uniref:hypothetical protein n=1 Tax=Bacillus sp. FJAT-27225 TaxID=1743144 RepID=UPI001112602D|nr:hypothetical protein [Bacillus sp. FJAT-27225]
MNNLRINRRFSVARWFLLELFFDFRTEVVDSGTSTPKRLVNRKKVVERVVSTTKTAGELKKGR